MAEAKKEEVKPKGPLGKLKEAIDDKEEQMLVLSTFVRLGILIWAGGILTLNYVTFPGMTEQDKICLLYTSPSPRDRQKSRMPSSA